MRIRGSDVGRVGRSRRFSTCAMVAALCALAVMLVGARFASAPISFAHPQSPRLPAAATELITDGGFEASVSPWKQYSLGGYTSIASALPHSGAKHFYACGYPACDDRVWQAVTVPATVNSATLTFWVASSLAPFNLAGPCRDGMNVLLEAADTTAISTLWSACRVTLGYTLIQVDATNALKPYAGKQVTVAFRGTTTNIATSTHAYSYWLVDDVSLSVS